MLISLAKSKLSFTNIFEELPVQVHNSHLVTMMLHNLEMPKLDASALRTPATFTSTQADIEKAKALSPNFDVLDLELDPFMQKNLEYLLDCSDVQQQELNNYQYWQRSVAREQVKIQAWLTKRVSWDLQQERRVGGGLYWIYFHYRDKRMLFVLKRDRHPCLRMRSIHCSSFPLNQAVWIRWFLQHKCTTSPSNWINSQDPALLDCTASRNCKSKLHSSCHQLCYIFQILHWDGIQLHLYKTIYDLSF